MRFPCLLLCLIATCFASAQVAYNSSFELQKSNGKLLNWNSYSNENRYMLSPQKTTKHSGSYALLIDGSNAGRSANEENAGIFYQPLPASLLAGKKTIRLEAWVKLDTPAYACLLIQKLGSAGQKIYYGFPDTSKKIEGWQHVKVEAPITNDGELYIGGLLNDKARAWFDDLVIYLDDRPLKDIAKPAPLPSASEIAWIKKRSIPLLSIEPQGQHTDLDALYKLTGNPAIIALGEPTHGTSEVFTLRLRLLKYLVEQQGFTTLMLEDELPEAGLINDYVLYGRDTAVSLVKKLLFPVWQNEEMVALIEWMRTYNQTHDKKIQFRGMDMQSVRVARQNLLRFGRDNDPTLAGQVEELAKMTGRLSKNWESGQRPLIKDSLVKLTENIQAHFESRLQDYGKKAQPDTLNWMQLNLAILAQYYPNMDWEMSSDYRDSCMAQNIIDYYRQYPDTKMLIWAHNSHVSRAGGMMGYWLNRYFKKRYFNIGFATSEGTYTASVDVAKTSWKAYNLEAPYAGTLEYYLQEAGSNYILPLPGGDEENRDGAWMGKKLEMRSIGFRGQEDQFSPVVPLEEFDALIFMKKTSHSRSYKLKK
ncbi:MAG TPA: erythromycin esterase family protein [Flavisolibacter sp.]|nr:erythromycin esterase family protein [Flavisolibacter sp.]